MTDEFPAGWEPRGPDTGLTEVPVGPAQSSVPIMDLTADARKRVTLQVPTIMLVALTQRADEAGLERLLPLDVRALLRRDGVHLMQAVTRVFNSDGSDFCRTIASLSLMDDPDALSPYQIVLDFPSALIGQLIEASQHGSGEVPMRERQVRPHPVRVPRWAGAISFKPVFERALEIATLTSFSEFELNVPTRQLVSTTEMALLADAHVLRVDPEQVAVLPAWGSAQDLFDFADEVTLPFEPLYLDFEGPGGMRPRVSDWGSGSLMISGALLFRNQVGELVIAPFGSWESDDGDEGHPMISGYGYSRWDSVGWLVFGKKLLNDEFTEERPMGEIELALAGTNVATKATVIAGPAAFDTDLGVALPGYVMLPTNGKDFSRSARNLATTEHGDAASRMAHAIAQWSEMVAHLAGRAMAALSILEAVETEIVDAPMEKRDRKRAIKRGWPIAQQVVIHSVRKKYASPPERSGEEAWYSHRFWVSATVAHYPLGTRMADARPDLVTACKRPPGSNCGFCRKVKKPAHLKGPDDAPVVLKTLVRHKT